MTASELAARVEAGSGEDRALDAEVALACGWTQQTPSRPDPIVGFDPYWRSPTGANISGSPPRLTSSIDAVVALIEERLPEWYWRIRTGVDARGIAFADTWVCYPDGDRIAGTGLTPARGLLSSFLRALAAQQQDRPTEGE